MPRPLPNRRLPESRAAEGLPASIPASFTASFPALLLGLVLLMAALAPVSGCAGPTPSPTQVPPVLEDVTVVLDWVPNTNHVGLFVALERGWFAEEGLEVEIVQAPDFNFIEMVGTGKAHFGVAAQEQLTQARANGVPVTAVAAILQHNTSGFAAPADREIRTPKDFEGKRYSGWGTELETAFLRTLMEKHGGEVDKVQVGTMAATDFFASMELEGDFAWIFYGWDGIAAEVRDYPITWIPLAAEDPALEFYTPILIAHERVLDPGTETPGSYPDLCRRFLRAVSRGYVACLDDPETCVDQFLVHAPETDRTLALRSVEYLSGEFVADAPRFGEMKAGVWDTFTAWMVENGILTAEPDMARAYTNDFLPPPEGS